MAESYPPERLDLEGVAPPSTPPPRTSWRSRVVLVILALAAFAFALARLRRVARPTFVSSRSYFGGDVAIGDVRLARRGASGMRLGSTLVCRGREVFSRSGGADFSVLAVDGSAHTLDVGVRRGDEIVERVRVDARDCAVRPLTARSH